MRFLILNNNQLSGGMPAELGELGKLEILNLRHNQLSRAIPSEFSGLTSLTRLDLLDNQLTGSIPSELGSMESLERLELNGNQLTGSIPTELGNLAHLTQLELNHNRLSGAIPSELGNLDNLTSLRLHNNQLTGSIPQELGSLANLQDLYLARNQLTGCIPAGLLTVPFTDFASLGLLDCSEDPPSDATCATGGAVPDAATNPGLVADCDALLSARVTLRGTATLDWSPSTAIEDWDGVTLGGMPQRVTKLNIARRGLLGTIPTELGNLTNLRELLLSVNNLTGAIPSALGNLSNLETLIMGNNNLTGEIPSDLGNLTNLTRLLFNSNQLSGEIPPELGNLVNLTELNLGWNRLTGNIPSELGNLSKLENLTLTVNRLSGCVPSGLEDQLQSYLFDRDIDFCDTQTTPRTPRNLTATADGQSEIDLSWSAPSDNGRADITGYRIEVSTNRSSWSNLVADTNSTSTSYSHTGLTAGSTRHYRVSAINSEGTGQASGTDSATTEEASNSAPTAEGSIPDQVIIQGTELTVDVSPYFSDPDDDALSYSIWSQQLFNAESVSGSTATLLLTSLFICDPTTVTITAQDPGGLEATQDFTLRRFNNPPVASSGTFPSQTIDVGETVPLYMGNWFSDTDICDSTLKYSAESSDTGKATVSTSGNTVSVMGEAAGSATITVTAEDGEGLTATLDIQVTVTSAAATKPGTPTGLTATANEQTQIDLSWRAPSVDGGADITGYKIEVSNTGSDWSDLVADTNSTSTRYSHTGLTAGSTRHYRVSAINSAGTGPASNSDWATTDSATAPDLAVGRPTVDDSTLETSDSFTLSATVRNDGDASSASTTLRYYRSSDSTISASDTAVGTDSVSGLSAGGSSDESISLTAPSTAGTYYFGACVDSVSEESDTTDNCSISVAVTVSAATEPDPTPRPTGTAVTGSVSSCDGEQLAPGIDTYRITIAGGLTAHRDVENVRVTGTFNGSVVGVDVVGDMDGGDTETFSITGYVSESVGTCGANIEWLEIS